VVSYKWGVKAKGKKPPQPAPSPPGEKGKEKRGFKGLENG